jgi:7-cyano-7-deazaguanine synthase
MANCIVLASGGPDSATVLAEAKRDFTPRALHINYGQINADRERVAAKKMANHFGIPIEVADIPGLRHIFLDKIGDAIDYNVGCWEVLPFMLGFPLSLAVSYGLTLDAETIMLGVHGTDVKDHPEYRLEALQAFEQAISVATNRNVKIVAPYVEMEKSELIKRGIELDVPYEKSWSCLLGGIAHCGRCWGCARRKLAFRDAGAVDPTDYEHKGIIELKRVDLNTMPSRLGLVYPELAIAQ